MGCIGSLAPATGAHPSRGRSRPDVAIEWETATVCCQACRPALVRLAAASDGRPADHGDRLPARREHAPTPKSARRSWRSTQGARRTRCRDQHRSPSGGDLGYVRDELAGLVYAVAPTPGQGDPRDRLSHSRAGRGWLPYRHRGPRRVRQERDRLFATGRRGGRDRAHAPGSSATASGFKAAGGVRTLDAMLAMLAAGAWPRRSHPATAAIGTELAGSAAPKLSGRSSRPLPPRSSPPGRPQATTSRRRRGCGAAVKASASSRGPQA